MSNTGENAKNVETKNNQGHCAVVEMGDGVQVEGNVCPARRRYAFLNDAGERIEENLDDVIVFSATGTVVAFPSGEPIEPVGTACEAVAIEISLFTKDGGDLTKKVHWNADHTGIFSDSRDCKMATGVMARASLPDWRDLGRELPLFPGNTALALGRMKPELPDAIHLVTKKSPECCRPGYASRTGDNLIFAKGMTAENKARLDELGGFFGALEVIWPGFEKIGLHRAPFDERRHLRCHDRPAFRRGRLARVRPY
jgi:hypothetical protein